MTFRNMMTATASSLALTLAAAPALMLSGTTATAQTEAETATFSGEQLDAFVTAFIGVNEVRSAYVECLEQAATEAEQQELVDEGNARIAETIAAVEGIDEDLYLAILTQASDDTALNERIFARIEAVAGG